MEVGRNKLRIQKQSQEENIIKNIRYLFKLKKENETMKDTTFRNTKTFSEQQEDYKPVRIGNFCNDNIRCESNGDRNKNLPVKEYLINRIPEYLNKIKPYL